MSYWVAASFGALDVRDHELSADGYEYVITPIHPAPPQFLWGDGAALWCDALESVIDDSVLDEPTSETLRQLEGLGVLRRADSAVQPRAAVSSPWLVSFQHELVYALLSNAAKQAGIDIIFIKGPVLHAQGLRLKVHSGDVDCWVRPGDEKILIEAMQQWGWRAARTAFDGTVIAHSQALRPGAWGCEIDVHTRFPGMTVDATAAFDLVLASSVNQTFAGTDVRVPSRAVHAVIYALHELRPVSGARHTEEQMQRAVHALASAGITVVDATTSLGAGFVLQDALAGCFPGADLSQLETQVPSDWGWRSIVSVPRRQLAALRLLPLRQRARVLFRLVWPESDASKRVRAAAGAPSQHLAIVRLKRLGEGLVRLLRGS
ncbi:hypothetical protein [Microbacterium sp. NPDC087591]|uniref:hypothetical protein n=1 Tax=Microbacterium sp. NPDC087591 TaxID=3364192 RepID=UPI003830038F